VAWTNRARDRIEGGFGDREDSWLLTERHKSRAYSLLARVGGRRVEQTTKPTKSEKVNFDDTAYYGRPWISVSVQAVPC
jgi:hypothetical protein